jgi:hypothetical protein
MSLEVAVVGEDDALLRFLRQHDAGENALAVESLEPDISYCIRRPGDDDDVWMGAGRESVLKIIDAAGEWKHHIVRHTVVGDVSFLYGILASPDDVVLSSFVFAARLSPRGLISHLHGHASNEFSLFPDLSVRGGMVVPSDT